MYEDSMFSWKIHQRGACTIALLCLDLYTHRLALVEASLLGCNFVHRPEVHPRLSFKRATI
jgi:hypothetical protein